MELKTTLITNFADLVFTTQRLKDKSNAAWPHLKIQLKNACCPGINIIIHLRGVRCIYYKGNVLFSLPLFFQKHKKLFFSPSDYDNCVCHSVCSVVSDTWCLGFNKERGEKTLKGDDMLEVEKWSYWSGPEEKSLCSCFFWLWWSDKNITSSYSPGRRRLNKVCGNCAQRQAQHQEKEARRGER